MARPCSSHVQGGSVKPSSRTRGAKAEGKHIARLAAAQAAIKNSAKAETKKTAKKPAKKAAKKPAKKTAKKK